MIERLLEFLNLSDEQKKQFENIKNSFEKEDAEINEQLKEAMKKKKESWKTKKSEFEGILTAEQKDRMNSLFDLFGPGKGKRKSGFKGC